MVQAFGSLTQLVAVQPVLSAEHLPSVMRQMQPASAVQSPQLAPPQAGVSDKDGPGTGVSAAWAPPQLQQANITAAIANCKFKPVDLLLII